MALSRGKRPRGGIGSVVVCFICWWPSPVPGTTMSPRFLFAHKNFRRLLSILDLIVAEPGAEFPPEAGRYHLFVAAACPWVSLLKLLLLWPTHESEVSADGVCDNIFPNEYPALLAIGAPHSHNSRAQGARRCDIFYGSPPNVAKDESRRQGRQALWLGLRGTRRIRRNFCKHYWSWRPFPRRHAWMWTKSAL